ncbi:MAG: O-antigen ligase family protein [Psychroserpens sp.]|nr:O-antigen ligase family protein [Psychroserpens sp.]
MIVIPIIFFLAMIIAKLQKGMFACLLVLVSTKSIIDAFWEFRIGPISFVSVGGLLIPILFFQLIYQRKYIPHRWLRTANIHIIALSLGIVWAVLAEPVNFVESLILNINIYLGFFIIPLLLTDKERLRQLLLAIMICGIFPILVSVYQLQTGVIFRERETVGLVRYVGFYHDAFPVRFYGMLTLFSILMYQSIFKTRDIVLNTFMVLLGAGAFVSIYAVFSKAAVAIFGLWTMVLLVFSKARSKQIFYIAIGLICLSIVFGDALASNIEQLFSKEVGYRTGELKDAKNTLGGRGYVWENYWEYWSSKQSFFFQWFGNGLDLPLHNEFLRILMKNGIVGFMFFIFFMFTSVGNVWRISKNIRVFAIMLFGMYFIDCIGLEPGKYYYYNVLVWGFFGTLLLRPQLFMKSSFENT